MLLGTGAKPVKGMRLDFLDQERYIWDPAVVMKIQTIKSKVFVSLRCIGWPKEYDELVEWTSHRIAPAFTFTKQVKGLLNLLCKKKRKPSQQELDALPRGARKQYGTHWPVMVHFRTPHPLVKGHEEDELLCLTGEDALRNEPLVFIQPYAPTLLPRSIQRLLLYQNGVWLPARNLRAWTDDPYRLGVLPSGFVQAHEMAQQDDGNAGSLPPNAMEKGALLRATYRIKTRNGARVRDGSLVAVTPTAPFKEDDYDSSYEDEPQDTVLTAKRDQRDGDVKMEHKEESSEEEQFEPQEYVPPPELPPPIRITDIIYPNCGVKRCKHSNQYTASVCMGGNEIILGTFPTQTQAYQASRIAASASGHEDDMVQPMETNLRNAQLADLQAISIDSVIAVVEKEYDPIIQKFCLHEWAMQLIRRRAYLQRVEEKQDLAYTTRTRNEADDIFNDMACASGDVKAAGRPRKNKHKNVPRKIDRASMRFIDH